MEKDFYKDLEKIKTIGSTYMAAVGLAPTAGAKVSTSWGALLRAGPGSAPHALGPRQALGRGLRVTLCFASGSRPWATLSVTCSVQTQSLQRPVTGPLHPQPFREFCVPCSPEEGLRSSLSRKQEAGSQRVGNRSGCGRALIRLYP